MNIRFIYEKYALSLARWRSDKSNRNWQLVKSARISYKTQAKDIFLRLSTQMGIAFAPSPEEATWSYHIFTDRAIILGGKRRSSGDPLCDTRDCFVRIKEFEEGMYIPDCPRCLELAERILDKE